MSTLMDMVELVVSEWASKGKDSYAQLVLMLRRAQIPEKIIGIVVLDLMRFKDDLGWQLVLERMQHNDRVSQIATTYHFMPPNMDEPSTDRSNVNLRKKSARFYPHNLERTATILKRYFSREDLNRLIELLKENNDVY